MLAKHAAGAAEHAIHWADTQQQGGVGQVGDGAASQSNVSSFRTLPGQAAGAPPAAYRIGVLGGLGVTQNSSDTVARLAQRCRPHGAALQG